MEVHAHTHTERKKFKHYLWEFLMLFLAVFCGFLAEYQLEHKLEKDRGREYVRSIYEDVKQDVYNLDSIIRKREYRGVMIDSLSLLLNSPNPNQFGKDIYFYARWLTYYYKFINNDRTIQQLKNSGGFRLIHDNRLIDLIMNYDQQLRWIDPTTQREEVFIENYIIILGELFDSNVFDQMLDKQYGFHRPVNSPALISTDKSKLQKLKSSIHFFKAMNIFLMNWQNTQRARARSILDYIESEYKLK